MKLHFDGQQADAMPVGVAGEVAAHGLKPSPAKQLWGTWFDESLVLRSPEGDEFTFEILTQIAAVETRERKRRQKDQSNHEVLVRRILANGIRCTAFRARPNVAYHRKSSAYAGSVEWLSGDAMARTIDLLADAGLVGEARGVWGVSASTYWATPRLLNIAEAFGVDGQSITQEMPSEALVRLREGNRDTPPLSIGWNDENRLWQALLEQYNQFFLSHDVALELSSDQEADLVRRLNADRRPETTAIIKPEFFKTALYRQFNNGSFKQGGRLYGGWWINVPGHLRKSITINGELTAELDYSGCAIRMLYHERGIEYHGDPYLIEPIAAVAKDNDLPENYFREAIKAMMQALINGDHDGRPEMASMPLSFKPYLSRSQVRQMIEEQHSPIADSFGSGAGSRLQRVDSDIALDVISELRKEGVLALPVHDSFLVQSNELDKLINRMNECYSKRMNFYPVIN